LNIHHHDDKENNDVLEHSNGQSRRRRNWQHMVVPAAAARTFHHIMRVGWIILDWVWWAWQCRKAVVEGSHFTCVMWNISFACYLVRTRTYARNQRALGENFIHRGIGESNFSPKIVIYKAWYTAGTVKTLAGLTVSYLQYFPTVE
jgi:hypothetical protein